MNSSVEVTLFSNPDQTISERFRKDFGNEIAKAFEIISKPLEYTAEQIESDLVPWSGAQLGESNDK